MIRQWYAREYREGDEEAILALHKLVFPSAKASKELWQWQYQKNPAGRPVIVLAESNQGEVVGQYAIVPRLTQIRKEACLGSLVLDTMVHPDYRNQGMFTVLTEQVYELAADRGIAFVYGFPNENSHHGFITKLSWMDIYKGIPLWIKPLNLENIVAGRFANNKALALVGRLGGVILSQMYRECEPNSTCVVKKVSYFDERFESFWHDCSKNYEIILVRDRSYLAWRFTQRPGAEYTIFIAEKGEKLAGYLVARCMTEFGLKIGFIVDILTRSEEMEVSRDLVFTAIRYFRFNSMDAIGCLMLPSVRYSRYFKQAGFIKARRGFLPRKMYLGVRSFSPVYPTKYLADEHNWFITWGDHDNI